MDQKIIEKQLKDNNWLIENIDQFIKHNIYPFLGRYVKDNEEVLSLAWTKELDKKGKMTTNHLLLVLTNIRIIVLSKDSKVPNEKIAKKTIELDDIKMVSSELSKVTEGSVRINLIYDNSGLSLESYDKESTDHFIKNIKWQQHQKIKNDGQQFKTSTIDLKEVEKLDEVKNPETIKKPKKSIQDKFWFEYLFGYSSILKSNPCLQIFLASSMFIWIIISSIAIGVYFDSYSLSKGGQIACGLFMFIPSMIAIAAIIPYIRNVWQKKLINNISILLIVEIVLIFFMMICSILTMAGVNSFAVADFVALIPAIIIFIITTLSFVKDYQTAKQIDKQA